MGRMLETSGSALRCWVTLVKTERGENEIRRILAKTELGEFFYSIQYSTNFVFTKFQDDSGLPQLQIGPFTQTAQFNRLRLWVQNDRVRFPLNNPFLPYFYASTGLSHRPESGNLPLGNQSAQFNRPRLWVQTDGVRFPVKNLFFTPYL